MRRQLAAVHGQSAAVRGQLAAGGRQPAAVCGQEKVLQHPLWKSRSLYYNCFISSFRSTCTCTRT